MGCPGQPKLSECVRAAQEALKRLSSAKTRHDWMVVGKGLQDLRAEAMRTAHVNKPTGRRYSQEFSALLKASGLDGISKATRSRLLAVLDHITEIESWLTTLPANKKLDLTIRIRSGAPIRRLLPRNLRPARSLRTSRS